MRNASLAYAKTHLSALVDRAEYHGEPTIILRHGKPSAALVPADAALAATTPMTDKEIAALFRNFKKQESGHSALRDLLASRR